MEKEKKIREPFNPEETPRPPQTIDPQVTPTRKKPGEEKKLTSADSDKDKSGKPGLLSDQAQINDETTI